MSANIESKKIGSAKHEGYAHGVSLLLTILAAISSLVLVFGGFWVMGHAFAQEGYEFIWFLGGILSASLGLWVAFGITPRLER
ncbi:hypothetical protein [Lysinibacter sp. HNR]|uniref:hypothetical protein n=1 Tax=Lysinibacter sp. HNR TaxID=3031408 RepID=UPI0024356BF9|nr:hypothetical protein [Lysinibacter sp. HNR]WGD38155.1 hypothetical protein FrondiHNR_04365 [Lysinibacter sp. HNR]